ncbi:hypothetical protein HDV00_006870 [Rhizophlyctis rosea]|nr:hypothetical protein HDV00_006870 [Rhizophlyctis rosea]
MVPTVDEYIFALRRMVDDMDIARRRELNARLGEMRSMGSAVQQMFGEFRWLLRENHRMHMEREEGRQQRRVRSRSASSLPRRRHSARSASPVDRESIGRGWRRGGSEAPDGFVDDEGSFRGGVGRTEKRGREWEEDGAEVDGQNERGGRGTRGWRD